MKRKVSTWSKPKPNSVAKLTKTDKQNIIKAEYDYIDRTNKEKDSIMLLLLGAMLGILGSSLTTLLVAYFGVNFRSILIVSLLTIFVTVFLYIKIKDLSECVKYAEKSIDMWKKATHVEFGSKLKVISNRQLRKNLK